MAHLVQRHLLTRELELMSYFALGIAADLRSGSVEDRLILLQGLLATSRKLSQLLWPSGWRAGDDLAAGKAAALRTELRLGEDHPLAPERTPPLAAALRLSQEELRCVVDLDRQLLTLTTPSPRSLLSSRVRRPRKDHCVSTISWVIRYAPSNQAITSRAPG